MTIPESFERSEETPRKTKITLKYTIRTENHGYRMVILIPSQILASIHHVEYASMDVEVKA